MKMNKAAVCILVIVHLSVVLCASFTDERILNANGYNNSKYNKNKYTTSANLTCPATPECGLTSIRCKSNSDCYQNQPVCCAAQVANETAGIRCCNPNSTPGLRICPGNNPPPACRSNQLCNVDSECFSDEICCRTFYGGALLNSSCCVPRNRGPQCPATVNALVCVQNEVCDDNNACSGTQVCCTVTASAPPGIRCCSNPTCPAQTQCVLDQDGDIQLCGAAPITACAPGQMCCHPAGAPFRCCASTPAA